MDKPCSGGKQPFETTDELSAQLRAAEQRIRELEAKVRQLEDRARAGVRGQRRKDPNAIGLKATGGQKSLIHWGSNCVRPDCMVEFAPGPGGQVWSECDE
jgi:hypothetical protein